jgi:hypothetical protein
VVTVDEEAFRRAGTHQCCWKTASDRLPVDRLWCDLRRHVEDRKIVQSFNA